MFLLISGVEPGIGLKLLLHLLTFFAAALMCHYELARDRPAPQYLTTYFLIMSLGGVLGGIFNSLIAPVIFLHAYEYYSGARHRVLDGPEVEPTDERRERVEDDAGDGPCCGCRCESGECEPNHVRRRVQIRARFVDRNKQVAVVLDFVIPS